MGREQRPDRLYFAPLTVPGSDPCEPDAASHMSTPPLPNAISASSSERHGINAATPLLLLPVHIQTRFVTGQEGSPQLWVRIYPDQIAVNSHEPQLTVQEIADGQAYWNALWQAGNPPPDLDSAKAPWRTLASLYTPQRAAWIALQLTPTNLSQQPVRATPAGVAPVPAPIFPSPPQPPARGNSLRSQTRYRMHGPLSWFRADKRRSTKEPRSHSRSMSA